MNLAIDPDELIIDNFAGGGGASAGIGMGLGRSPDIAINHDPEAIAMHRANHPETHHYCENIRDVDPVAACGGRRVGLAWFSPDCKHHSKAKGGKPVDKKIRGLARIVIHWARKVAPRVIILENVEEFQFWGPLTPDNRPCPERKGRSFRGWRSHLTRIGYRVEWRELRACDYGAPTIRRRLFVVARRDGLPIVWPEPTHGDPKKTRNSLFDRHLKPWRTAAECIDWSIPCRSIFDRKKSLAENTLHRIAAGIRRYVIESPSPFIVNLTHVGGERVENLGEPLRTVTGANRGEKALCTPFVTKFRQNSTGSPLDEPLHTITAGGDMVRPAGAAHAMGIVVPTLIQTGYGEREGQAPRVPGLGKPLGTAVGSQKHALVGALLKHYGGVVGSELVDPIGTVTATDHHSLMVAHIQRDFTRSVGHAADEPLGTVTANWNGKSAVVASHLLKLHGTCRDGQPLDGPMATVRAQGNHLGEVRAFLVKYFGKSDGQAVDQPLDTVTPKHRFGLVMIHGEPFAIVDIGLRMLSPRELFRAQGFGESYVIDLDVDGKPLSKTAQVRMVGNSVCPPIAAAVARAQFEV